MPMSDIQQLQPDMATLFMRALISMVVILLLTYFVLRLIKRQQDIQLKRQNDSKLWIRIYDYQALGPNRGIYLIELFSRIYVVGATENGINILREVAPDDEEWLAVKDMLSVPGKIIPPGFHKFIGRWRKDFKDEMSRQLNADVSEQLTKMQQLYRRQTPEGGNKSE